MVGIDEAITRLNEAIACECDGERSRQFIDDLKLVVAAAEAGRWRPIETAPKGEEVLIAYWRWRNSTSPGSVVVQSAMQTEYHGPGIWSWVVSDNKHGPFPIRGWSNGDMIGWRPIVEPLLSETAPPQRAPRPRDQMDALRPLPPAPEA